jgi:pimeloyl-ACP methyl ester carboxylesterase
MSASTGLESAITIPDTSSRFLDPAGSGKHGEGRLRYLTGGRRAPLVLLHTVRTQAEHFRELIALVQDRYTVYALDLPGMGYSQDRAWRLLPGTRDARRRQAADHRTRSERRDAARRVDGRLGRGPLALPERQRPHSPCLRGERLVPAVGPGTEQGPAARRRVTQVPRAGHFIALERPDVPTALLNASA